MAAIDHQRLRPVGAQNLHRCQQESNTTSLPILRVANYKSLENAKNQLTIGKYAVQAGALDWPSKMQSGPHRGKITGLSN